MDEIDAALASLRDLVKDANQRVEKVQSLSLHFFRKDAHVICIAHF